MSSTITTRESDMRNVLIMLSLTPFLKIGDYTENCHGYKNQCASIQSMLDTSIPGSPHEFKGIFSPFDVHKTVLLKILPCHLYTSFQPTRHWKDVEIAKDRYALY